MTKTKTPKKSKKSKLWINTSSSFLTGAYIKKIEGAMNARYIFESCVKTKSGQWANVPVAVFYQKKAHPLGSNYFGLYYDHRFDETNNTLTKRLMICDAKSAVDGGVFTGIIADSGEILYSRYRHDYRSSEDDTVWIDGGHDYTRYGGGLLVRLRVSVDKMEIMR